MSLDLWVHLTTACLSLLFYRPEDKHATPGHSKICHESDLSSPMDPDLRSITASEDCRIILYISSSYSFIMFFFHDAEFVDHAMGLFWQLLCKYFDISVVYTFCDVSIHAV